MPLKISKSLKLKLPEDERDKIEKLLKDKAGGICWLCQTKLNYASDTIVADHEIPEAAGGETKEKNLNLAHDRCNSFKRDHATIDVRPYLRLLEKMKQHVGVVKYDDVLKLMDIEPKLVHLTLQDGIVEIQSPDGSVRQYPVFQEQTADGIVSYAFAELPITAVFNDSECQPRAIKPQHLWAIYNDLKHNPLHEPPGCRALKAKGDGMYKLVMFDGQHKSIASWITGRKTVVFKVYIDFPRENAVRLVNSIQAKIRKLPLSPFELAAKMAEEWQDRLADYEKVLGDKCSEDGFLNWVEKDERARAKAAFADALIQNIIESQDLAFNKYVASPGAQPKGIQITQSAFRNKVLRRLLREEPLKEVFSRSQALRNIEAENIVRLLNIFVAHAFEPAGKELTEHERTRAKRVTYQGSLQYVMGLLRRLMAHRLVTDEGREFMDKVPDAKSWATLEEDIERLMKHPVWTAEFDRSEKMNAVKEALSKNQDMAEAFGAVGLKLGYVIGADKVSQADLD